MIFFRFVCSGQCGHTVLAHIIDSHPNAMVSEESRVSTKVAYSKWEPEHALEVVKKSSKQVMNTYEKWGEVERPWGSYRNKFGKITEWNGKFEDLKVFGDKHGWDGILGGNSNLLFKTQRRMNTQMKVIHMVRNPYELISSWYLGHMSSSRKIDVTTVDKKVDDLIYFTEQLHEVCYERLFPDILLVKLEDLIHYTDDTLDSVFSFLGLDLPGDVLEGAKKVLFNNPREYRTQVPWTRITVKKVKEELIDKYPFFGGYT
jgi:hypothetical protein